MQHSLMLRKTVIFEHICDTGEKVKIIVVRILSNSANKITLVTAGQQGIHKCQTEIHIHIIIHSVRNMLYTVQH